jgi:hypothetical protein
MRQPLIGPRSELGMPVERIATRSGVRREPSRTCVCFESDFEG